MTSDIRLFRDSIDTISQLIDDGTFRIKKDSIELVAADRAMVAVVDFKIKSSAFDEFECKKEGSITLNLLNLLTILKRAGIEDRLKMELNESENRLEITLEGKSVRKFAIPLLEVSQEEIPPVSQFEFLASADVRGDVIEQGVNDADIIADSIVFELSDNKLRMVAEGDSSKAELNLEKGNAFLINLDVKKNVKSRYPLDYLKKILKGLKISENVKIQLGNDYPMKIDFSDKDVSMTFILAPRVSED